MRLNIVTLVIALGAALACAAYFIVGPHPPWTPMRIAGVAIAVPSFILLVIARLQLGASFSVQAKAHVLVTKGIYARIRNPIYVFGTLIMTGVGLYVRHIYLLLLVIVIPMQIVRARNEERVLADKFGDEYQRYKAGTWF